MNDGAATPPLLGGGVGVVGLISWLPAVLPPPRPYGAPLLRRRRGVAAPSFTRNAMAEGNYNSPPPGRRGRGGGLRMVVGKPKAFIYDRFGLYYCFMVRLSFLHGANDYLSNQPFPFTFPRISLFSVPLFLSRSSSAGLQGKRSTSGRFAKQRTLAISVRI